MPTQYHMVELPSGLRVEVRAQSWPEFREEMDARVDALEKLTNASDAERAQIGQWRSPYRRIRN